MLNFIKTTTVILTFFLVGCTSIKTPDVDIKRNPYNPIPLMDQLKSEKGDDVTKMHFLVFGDAKGNKPFPYVLKRADSLDPDFCITTADLVDTGGGKKGKVDYKKLDSMGGWFMRKYPMWPTVGNHEESGGDDGIENFTNFFGMKEAMYCFEYGNAKFIALPWPKINQDSTKLKWLESELKSAQGKHIFIYRHRPFYTVGSKPYTDVDSAATATTRLFDQYNVTAAFSGHDHIYHRTKRNNTNYIISAGAGAPIYELKREKDALENDVFYGKKVSEERVDGLAPFKFRDGEGNFTDIQEAMYYVLSVKIDGNKVSIEMIDEKTGKVWDKAVIK
ncbi:MAG: metallophosphoesterase [Reichenbachiella sp.]